MDDPNAVTREILLAFWKVHILLHADTGPVVGQWMLQELRRHGYDASPGTIYPLLHRMERRGWLRSEADSNAPRAQRRYYLTDVGREVLVLVNRQVQELADELPAQGFGRSSKTASGKARAAQSRARRP